MGILRTTMLAALGGVVWTHVGYPATAALLARRIDYRPRRDEAYEPTVSLIIAAHDEEAVIGERLENALAIDYPAEKLEIVVTSDASTDRTHEIVRSFADRGVRLIENERGGKLPAQQAAVGRTESELVAFSDANSMWEANALRLLVAPLADPEVGYVCGRLRLVSGKDGRSREGLYWRYELWLRAQESRLGSITAGNGAIYALRRSALPELPPFLGHDLSLPFRLGRRGLRAVYEARAVATEPAAASTGAEWGRKVRMMSRSWWNLTRGGMLDPRGQRPLYVYQLYSHRLLRYASGLLHAALLVTSALLASGSPLAALLLAGQVAWLALALCGWRRPGLVPLSGVAWYYLVVTAASAAALVRLLRHGPQATWRPAEGTR
jgi:cellulose synthase/poly-beta-1,6-N-acetylglucosamine synthase-like glycosyltransferase